MLGYSLVVIFQVTTLSFFSFLWCLFLYFLFGIFLIRNAAFCDNRRCFTVSLLFFFFLLIRIFFLRLVFRLWLLRVNWFWGVRSWHWVWGLLGSCWVWWCLERFLHLLLHLELPIPILSVWFLLCLCSIRFILFSPFSLQIGFWYVLGRMVLLFFYTSNL